MLTDFRKYLIHTASYVISRIMNILKNLIHNLFKFSSNFFQVERIVRRKNEAIGGHDFRMPRNFMISSGFSCRIHQGNFIKNIALFISCTQKNSRIYYLDKMEWYVTQKNLMKCLFTMCNDFFVKIKFYYKYLLHIVVHVVITLEMRSCSFN